MAFIYDRTLYRAIDAERDLTFHVTGFGKEQEAKMSLSHRDGSVGATAYDQAFSPGFREKIDRLQARYAEAWLFVMPKKGSYRLGGIEYTESALTVLLQEAADAFAYRMTHDEGDVLLAEVSVQF